MEKRKISQEELKEILKKHEKFLKGSSGERADLRYADLRGVDLRGVDLAHANLRYANLRGVDLTDAILIGANLRYANLTGADLKDADLTSANLTSVDLTYANLSNTVLTNTNLTNTTIYNTNFSNVGGKTIISIQLYTSIFNRVINYIPEIDWVSAGCFHGTLDELKDKVKDTHSHNEKIQKRYEKAIEFIEFLKEDYEND